MKYGNKDCCSELEKPFPIQSIRIMLKTETIQVKLKYGITNLRKIEAGVSQGSVLYLIYTSDLPTSDNTTTASLAGDTAILASHQESGITSMELQHINEINEWAKN
jgi:hypothetical protein